jgi:hypothetical protein
MLGPRPGAFAAALAAALSFALWPIVAALAAAASSLFSPYATPIRRVLTFDFRAVGHIVSLGCLGLYAGRLGRLPLDRQEVARWAQPLGLPARTEGARPPWLFVPLVALFSLYVEVSSGRSWMLGFTLLPLLIVTVVIMGARCGAASAAWTALIATSALALAAPILGYVGWELVFALAGVRLRVQVDQSSAVTVVILTAAAWIAGKVDLRGSRANRYRLALAIFSAFEVASIVKTGEFLLPYAQLVLGGVNLALPLSLVRLLEPWFIATLVQLILSFAITSSESFGGPSDTPDGSTG